MLNTVKHYEEIRIANWSNSSKQLLCYACI